MRRRRYLTYCGLVAGSALAGCSNGGAGDDEGGQQGIDNELLLNRVREALQKEDAEIRELTDEGEVVTLVYLPGGLSEGADESEIQTRVEETVRAVSETFYEPIVGPGSGWRADRLEATVLVEETVVATYTLETAWAEECSETGDTIACIEQRVQESVERPAESESETPDGA